MLLGSRQFWRPCLLRYPACAALSAPEWGQGVCVWPDALEEVPCPLGMEVSKWKLRRPMVWLGFLHFHCHTWHQEGKVGL